MFGESVRMQLFTSAHFSLTVSFLILLRLLRIILDFWKITLRHYLHTKE